jgi:OmpA-OmpF porin, OOP family
MKLNKNLLTTLLVAWIGLFSYLCRNCFCGTDAAAATSSGAVSSAGLDGGSSWTVSDGSFSVSSPEFFRFLKSNSSNVLGYGSGLDQANIAVKEYVMKDGTKGINVVGYYGQEETNDNPLFANLGLSRANEVKQKLVQMGIDANKISLGSELLSSPTYNGDTLSKGASYTISKMEDNSAKIADLKAKLTGKPIVLYFKTNSNELDLSAEQQQQFSDLFSYLDNTKDAKLEVSGHTDSDGSKAANVKLSQERAAFIKQYLIDKGNLAESVMSVAGYGPDKPIASNATKEGKAQNRRVEVVLK